MTDYEKKIQRYTTALGLKESNLDYGAKGGVGEGGAFQWKPETWQAHAKETKLDANDFSPLNQNRVAYRVIKNRFDAGYEPREVAAEWNSGNRKNWQNHKGTYFVDKQTLQKVDPNTVADKSRIKRIDYDTPAYTEDVARRYQSLKRQETEQPRYQGGPAGALGEVVDQVPHNKNLGGQLADRVGYAVGDFNNPDARTATGGARIWSGAKDIWGGLKGMGSQTPTANPTGMSEYDYLYSNPTKVLEGGAKVALGVANIAGATGGAVLDTVGAGLKKVIGGGAKLIDDSAESFLEGAIRPEAKDWYNRQKGYVREGAKETVRNVMDSAPAQAVLSKAAQVRRSAPEFAQGTGDAANIIFGAIPAVKTATAAKGMFSNTLKSYKQTEAGQMAIELARQKGTNPEKVIAEVVKQNPHLTHYQQLAPEITRYKAQNAQEIAQEFAKKKLTTKLGRDTFAISGKGDDAIAAYSGGGTSLEDDAFNLARANSSTSDLNKAALRIAKDSKLLSSQIPVADVTRFAGTVDPLGASAKHAIGALDDYPVHLLIQEATKKGMSPYLQQAILGRAATIAQKNGMSKALQAWSNVLSADDALQWIDDLAQMTTRSTIRDTAVGATPKAVKWALGNALPFAEPMGRAMTAPVGQGLIARSLASKLAKAGRQLPLGVAAGTEAIRGVNNSRYSR